VGKPIATKGVILKVQEFTRKDGTKGVQYRSKFIPVGDRSITLTIQPKAGMVLPDEIWVNVSSWNSKSNDL